MTRHYSPLLVQHPHSIETGVLVSVHGRPRGILMDSPVPAPGKKMAGRLLPPGTRDDGAPMVLLPDEFKRLWDSLSDLVEA